MINRSGRYHAALASTSRRWVLDALLSSPEPLAAVTVADHLGIHLTTARFHLDQLTAAGLIQRRVDTVKRRGRPRLLYGPAGLARDGDAREQLIQVLVGALAHENSVDADASLAGRRWAATFDPPDPDDPAPGLVEVFERLEFDPDVDTDADTIRLRGCPFRDAAREHREVVCAVHRGLIEQLLDGTTRRARLIPFVEAELCVVTLERAGIQGEQAGR
jgi:predicted ArsR family transcriptional regulator